MTPAPTKEISLPGSIPGLLRFGSCVRHRHGNLGAVRSIHHDGVRVMWSDASTAAMPEDLRLVLFESRGVIPEPTSLAHAVWWLHATKKSLLKLPEALFEVNWSFRAWDTLCSQIAHGEPVPEEDVLILRRVVLFVAGLPETA